MNTVTILAALLRYMIGVDMTPHDTQERSGYRYIDSSALSSVPPDGEKSTVDAEARYCLASTCIVRNLS